MGAEIRQRVLPQVAPEVFHGVQLGRVRRQLFERDGALGGFNVVCSPRLVPE